MWGRPSTCKRVSIRGLGRFTFGPTFASSAEAGECLVKLSVVFPADVAGASFELDGSRAVRVGRSRRCDLVVADPTVSRIHAEFRLESERVVVHDLNSTNGTFVNDVRTVREAVGPCDRLRLGSAELVLSSDGPSNPIPSGWAEQGKVGEILSGIAENLSPVDLVQILASHGKTGTLMLYKKRFGRIDFKEGQVCFAKVGAIEGEKAFHRILSWEGAEFQFRSGLPTQANLKLRTERLLVEHMTRQEELQSLKTSLPDPHTELGLKPLTSGVKLSPSQQEVVRAVSQSMTLAALMDACSIPDVEVARAVATLIDSGVLYPASPLSSFP